MSIDKTTDPKPIPLKLFIYSTTDASTVFVLARNEEEAEKKIRKTDSGRLATLTKKYVIGMNEVVFSHATVAVEQHNEISGPIPTPVYDNSR